MKEIESDLLMVSKGGSAGQHRSQASIPPIETSWRLVCFFHARFYGRDWAFTPGVWRCWRHSPVHPVKPQKLVRRILSFSLCRLTSNCGLKRWTRMTRFQTHSHPEPDPTFTFYFIGVGLWLWLWLEAAHVIMSWKLHTGPILSFSFWPRVASRHWWRVDGGAVLATYQPPDAFSVF